MRFLIQRVNSASVTVGGKIIGSIPKGLLVFVGISDNDTEEIADRMIKKLLHLRIFEDENGKTNLDLFTVNGELLIISQFTLYADCSHGNRPSFTNAGNPILANTLYEYIIKQCYSQGIKVSNGLFGADMKVSIQNDGPFTICLDSKDLHI